MPDHIVRQVEGIEPEYQVDDMNEVADIVAKSLAG